MMSLEGTIISCGCNVSPALCPSACHQTTDVAALLSGLTLLPRTGPSRPTRHQGDNNTHPKAQQRTQQTADVTEHRLSPLGLSLHYYVTAHTLKCHIHSRCFWPPAFQAVACGINIQLTAAWLGLLAQGHLEMEVHKHVYVPTKTLAHTYTTTTNTRACMRM